MYRPNRSFKREIGRIAELRRAAQRSAENTAEDMRRIVRAEAYESGALHDSIRAGVTEEDGLPVGFVSVDVPYWFAPEFGTERNRAVAYMRRTRDKVDFK